MLRSFSIVAVLILTLALSPAARAGDVKLLKQPSAFPLVIDKAGSYRLKGNVTVPDANTTAISITAADVTLDLNGYAITGPVVCSGTPVTSCSPTGSGKGIDGSLNSNITVVNGTVRGMGDRGVYLGQRARVEKVRSVSNGNFGISTLGESTVTGSTAIGNGQSGIMTGGTSTATGNVTENNAGDGIDCVDCVVTGNVLRGNAGDGLECFGVSTVIGNTAGFNGGFGLNFGGSNGGYANNVIRLNSFGTVSGGTDMGHNVCELSTTCP